MHGSAAQLLMAGALTNSGFDQSRPGQVEPAALSHQQLVAEHGQVAAARHAVAQDGSELRNPGRGDDGVVTKDAAKVVLVREDFILKRQENSGAVHQIDERQTIVLGDALGAENFLAGHGKEGAGFDRGVIGDDHDATAGDRADAGDDAGGRRAAPILIHAPGGPQT